MTTTAESQSSYTDRTRTVKPFERVHQLLRRWSTVTLISATAAQQRANLRLSLLHLGQHIIHLPPHRSHPCARTAQPQPQHSTAQHGQARVGDQQEQRGARMQYRPPQRVAWLMLQTPRHAPSGPTSSTPSYSSNVGPIDPTQSSSNVTPAENTSESASAVPFCSTSIAM